MHDQDCDCSLCNAARTRPQIKPKPRRIMTDYVPVICLLDGALGHCADHPPATKK